MNRTKGNPGSRTLNKGEFPVRMCAVCRKHVQKNNLIRFGEGRGVYLCIEGTCIDKAVKKGIVSKEQVNL